MTRTSLILRLVLLVYAVLPGRSVFAGMPPGQVIGRVVCEADPSQSYALYIPVRGNKHPLPVVYCFDSHGAGAFPLQKYKALADAYGFILVGSNNSKNGNDWPTAEKIWDRLFEDTKKRLSINESRLYTCGFSGGAKVAGFVAIQHPVIKGVIANGAGLPDGVSAGNFPFSFTAIAGEGDMNMTDLVSLTGELDKTRTRHRILFFDGRHEWAPAATMRVAFEGLELDAMQMQLTAKDPALIDGYVTQSKSKVGEEVQAGQWIKAYRECQAAMSYLEGLSADAGWFRQKAATLGQDKRYQQQEQVRQSLLATEQRTKAEYMQHFEQTDVNYWTRTIDGLRVKGVGKTSESGMYQRLLAYLSLAFYSISNQLINGGQNAQARYFTDLYKMADPGNSEAWYFSALLHAREGDGPATAADLQKAVGTGFNDRTRLQQQPEYQRLGSKIDLPAIERNMQ